MIKIKQSVHNEMIAHAKEAAPIESCGYLAGKDGLISAFYPMTNLDNSPDHFSFDPKEQFTALKQARESGLELLSVYHSHPVTPARLSQEDIRLFNDPHMVYIIVSLMKDTQDVKGFKVIKSDDSHIEISAVYLEIID